MNRFLEEVAKYIFTEHQENLHQVTLVFPNRRAGVFFKGYLQGLIEQPVLSPQITTINELVQNFSQLRKSDPLTLIVKLYGIYQQVTGSSESFDDFYYWAEMLIGDFDDLDKYLVKADDLFRNIADLKEIDEAFEYLSDDQKEFLRNFWGNIGKIKKSQNSTDFLELWEVLNEVYIQFKALLHNSGEAYEGMIYREMVNRLNAGEQIADSNNPIYFIGFNAINPCEKALFAHLKKIGIARFLWDYDDYYVNDNRHEAGMFMRENLKRFPAPENFSIASEFKKDKKIQLVVVPSKVGQTQALAYWMQQKGITAEKQFDKTAVVLGEENLLLQTLGALPDNYSHVNVTMGYPFSASPVCSLLNTLLELQKTVVGAETKQPKLGYRSVLAVLNHPLVRQIDDEGAIRLRDEILKHNKVYIAPQEVAKDAFWQSIFRVVNSSMDIGDYLLAALRKVFSQVTDGKTESIVQEYVYQAYVAINRFKDVVTEWGDSVLDMSKVKRETVFRIVDRYLGGISVPFEGEPLGGLQVMGILETRNLDFENVFMLSVNEGIMPSGGGAASFVPYQLRRAFGMPSVEQMDAMYAYYFYRTIQRAKNVFLFYNPVANGLNSGEMSRYIYQLKFESGIEVEEHTLLYDIEGAEQKEILIAKNEAMIDGLAQRFAKYPLSPSALNTYMECGMRFYFRYVAGLREPREVTQEIGPDVFGSILHTSLEELYKPMVGKQITVDTLDSVLKNNGQIDAVINKAFNQEYFNQQKEVDKTPELVGRNRLIFRVIKKTIKEFVRQDKKIAPFQIKSLEENVVGRFPVHANDKQYQIQIGGFIDRLDYVDGKLRVIDYKSGSDKLDFSDVESLFNRDKMDRRKAAFQTLLYAQLVAQKYTEHNIIHPGIYQIRDVYSDEFNPLFKTKVDGWEQMGYNAVEGDFREGLNKLLTEIFDVRIAFAQVDEKKNKCGYCPYNAICHRSGSTFG
ncbi:PD-(D/E)XK nuclease family protein [Prolixibacteraceae bacterium JC049]|nr:PD-(D/E)XK nuclease family protein [Prolixibacteraceae bacterium JC049]